MCMCLDLANIRTRPLFIYYKAVLKKLVVVQRRKKVYEGKAHGVSA